MNMYCRYGQRLVLDHWDLAAFPLDGYFLTGLTYLNLQYNQLRVQHPNSRPCTVQGCQIHTKQRPTSTLPYKYT